MNRNAQELQAVERAETELVDESATFFAPVSSDVLDELLGQYQARKRSIEQLADALLGEEFRAAMSYFLEASEIRRGHHFSISSLADVDGAMSVLDASYWSKALALTDVLDCMPQSRRDQWNTAIADRKTVPFTEEAVRPTIADLLASRHKFFCERVDGIFRGLSGTHVTNQPQGFSKRMILSYVLSDGYPNHSRAGLINDLRSVIATFMGRPGLKHYETANVLRRIAESGAWGEWHDIDGGALRIRIYRGVGTAHLEINPEISYRLNSVLASLYPMAIPAKFRARPTSKPKTFKLMERPLPFAVLRLLEAGGVGRHEAAGTWEFSLSYSGKDEGKHALREAERVLEAIGGVPSRYGYTFDFNPTAVLNKIRISGCIPDAASFQFYPTPSTVAEAVYEMLGADGPEDNYLEPSAGIGGLAGLLPAERTTCVEISGLRCDVLRARGYQAHQADFIAWATAQRAGSTRWTKCLMNPPFADGRALAHLHEASTLVQAGGRIVAILPASMRGKDLLEGWAGEWSGVFSNEFAGTGVSVAIYAATKP
ncbi:MULTISPECIES: DUF4942 domain-containing protein [unclassified Variovorax]|uniref:DUF4942 domain-containing protein n=1 Tax=unclassified Variovorax TaxID=663243 RepID=UPI00076DE097|nr:MULTISPECIES: DUF4942 domain-containing protein [unclassified Variovorax]KWT97709.1 putative DNA restriction/recombination methylase [Variovorax sp. WDL1]PNG48809.1 hypothetical protein CHC06_06550 [Variovorax sp. B2]PNG49316.1 hypothetical protein CHC07_06198 [Variovorax sp. B4]VTV18401.1 hypothetical protein WDL1P2_00126 [Variovorax sp. WDL1]